MIVLLIQVYFIPKFVGTGSGKVNRRETIEMKKLCGSLKLPQS